MYFITHFFLFSCLILGQQEDLSNRKPNDINGFIDRNGSLYVDGSGARARFNETMQRAHSTMNGGLNKMSEYMDLCDIPPADEVIDNTMACVLVAQMASEVQLVANKGMTAHQKQDQLKFNNDFPVEDFSNAFDSAKNYADQLANLGFTLNLISQRTQLPSGVTVKAEDLTNPTALTSLGFNPLEVQLATDSVDSTNVTVKRSIASINSNRNDPLGSSTSSNSFNKANTNSSGDNNNLKIDFNGTPIGVAKGNLFKIVSQVYQTEKQLIFKGF